MKEARKTKAFAVLHDCPSSPQKMRLVADLVRGMDVQRALDTLKFCPKEAARKVEKLLLSAIANWSVKNEGQRVDDAALYIKEIFVVVLENHLLFRGIFYTVLDFVRKFFCLEVYQTARVFPVFKDMHNGIGRPLALIAGVVAAGAARPAVFKRSRRGDLLLCEGFRIRMLDRYA